MYVTLLVQLKELGPAEIGKGNFLTKQNELEKRAIVNSFCTSIHTRNIYFS